MSEENTKIDLSGDGGVLKEIVKEGNGDERPTIGCQVSLHYTGKLTDGKVFDSSIDRGEPFAFDLGLGRCIKAFDMGVATMRKGEKCVLTCAPEYAYGVNGSPPSIPPNATLIFELEMLDWKGEDISPNKDGSIERFILEKSDKKRSPSESALVKIHITGRYNQKIFDDRDVDFCFGEGSDVDVVEGVELGLQKMVVGETSKFIIKPQFAFGIKGKEEFNIPPNATVEYLVKLIDCEKGIEEWKLTDEETVAQAKIFKDKGTKYYQKSNYLLALKMYKKAAALLSNGREEGNKTKIAAVCNVALCHQKCNDLFEAKQACNEVLQLDPKNIKALFRRGQCNLAINDFSEALDDFQKVIELEPSNKAALNQIQICKHKIKESSERERKIYANMFTKFAAADKEQPEPIADSDVLDKCGEWTDEDAKREVDLAFERDSNIVMI